MTLEGYTIGQLSKEIGISAKTLSTKLNNAPEKFTQGEMQKIVAILNIKNPLAIFFAH